MAERIITRRTIISDPVVTEEPAVYTTGEALSTPIRESLAANLVYFVAGVVEILLAIRFVLEIVGASAVSSFVSFIYNLSDPLVAPFYGMFSTHPNFTISRFDFETLAAMVVYAVVAYILATIFNLLRV